MRFLMIWQSHFVQCVPARISPVAVWVAVNPFEQTQVAYLLITNDKLVIDTRQGNNRLWEVGPLPEEPYAESQEQVQ